MTSRRYRHRKTCLAGQRITFQRGSISGLLAAGGLVLLFLILTGEAWRAIAYAAVAMFVFLIGLAVYFWGFMLLGGLAFALTRKWSPVPWQLGENAASQEFDIDPGLELVAAGMLVYRLGEVRPGVHFRQVPLDGARAIRPFVVARTGAPRPYEFVFTLKDATDRTRFENDFASDLASQPKMVMPGIRLLVNSDYSLAGQCWTLQVRSGLTVITSFRFTFTNGDGIGLETAPEIPAGDRLTLHQQRLIPGLLDQALRHDVNSDPQNMVLWEE